MSLVLKEPVKKKQKFHRNLSVYSGKPALPLVLGSDGEHALLEDVWYSCTGRFNGLSVVVDDPHEMKTLHTMGFFGKGCLSKRVPDFGGRCHGPPILRERQWTKRLEWSKSAEALEEEAKAQSDVSDEPESKRQKLSEEREEDSGIASREETGSNQVLVIADSDTEDDYMERLNPRIEIEKVQTVFESLHLSLEEAFFLAYAIGSLQVVDLMGNFLPIYTLWNVLRQTDSCFVETYVAYHYFRAKGWVVKPGMQFGGQFILYKKGPVFYHSSYVVLVEIYNSDRKRVKNNLTLFKLANLNRLTEASFKEILICEVHRPNAPADDFKHPGILSKFTVRENLIRRWIPNQEREAVESLSTVIAGPESQLWHG